MFEESSVLDESFRSRARELMGHMEAGNAMEAARVIDELTRLRESSLFLELGKLTREFHETLNSFRLDSRIAELAETDIPDARDRLNYVITMTQQAADRTLGAVEEAVPLCERLEARSGALKSTWERFLRREMDANEFRSLSREIDQFLVEVHDDHQRLRANLQEVLMAQGFQDLTGQIIRRVITLVEDLEKSLVDLIRLSGQRPVQVEQSGADIKAAGPAVPGANNGDTVSGQDEVDSLLSSLGF